VAAIYGAWEVGHGVWSYDPGMNVPWLVQILPDEVRVLDARQVKIHRYAVPATLEEAKAFAETVLALHMGGA
jgi:hypothetical protein